MRAELFEIAADKSHTIHGTRWLPDGKPRQVIQIFHGLGEHCARYERFAAEATAHDFAVVAHNHRGHGPNSAELGIFAPSGGWQALIDDARLVRSDISQRFGSLPLVLLGHSMGSYIAQNYVMQHPANQDALVLSASTWAGRLRPALGHCLARLVTLKSGKSGRSPFLDQVGFGDFNKRFEPARTELDWLSRDDAEVDLYVADPLCGGPYTTSLWLDLTRGLFQISSVAALRRIPAALPILLTGGSADPVGGRRGIERLGKEFLASGHSDVTVRLYEGGRHEMLNEINREEFTRDLLGWISSKLPGVTRT